MLAETQQKTTPFDLPSISLRIITLRVVTFLVAYLSLTSFVLTIPALTYCPRGNPSIVGADAFHFSVRNGKRWYHIAQKTESLSTNYFKQYINMSKCSYPPKLAFRLFSSIGTRLKERFMADFVAKLCLAP